MINIKVGDLVVSECGIEGVFVGEGVLRVPNSGRYDYFKLNTIICSDTGEHKTFKSKIYLKKDVDYIKSFKHMIGVSFVSERGFFGFVGGNYSQLFYLECLLKLFKFYDHNDNLLTYKEYMQLYYPEYEFIWKEQLSE